MAQRRHHTYDRNAQWQTYLSIAALAPAAHLLLKLSYSRVELALLSLIFAFEEKSALQQYPQIWTLCLRSAL